MARFWLIIGGLLSFINLVQAQSYNLNVRTPVVADSTQSFVDLSVTNKKWQLKLRSDKDECWVSVKIRRRFVDAYGVLRERYDWIKHDVNGVFLQLKPQLKRLGLSRLPTDSAAILIKACYRHGQTAGYWLFIEGAYGYLWLSTFIKVEGSAVIRGQVRLYKRTDRLSLKAMTVDSLPEAWLLKDDKISSLTTHDGELFNFDKNTNFSVDSLLQRKAIKLVSPADTNWVIFDDNQSPVFCGWYLGCLIDNNFVSERPAADSTAQLFYFNGRALKVLDAYNLSQYDLPFLTDSSQSDFKFKTISKTKVLEVSDFGQPKVWIWPANKTITPVPDTVYSSKLGSELILVAKRDNFLAVVDSNSQLIDYSLPSYYKLLSVESKNLANLDEGLTNEFQPQFDLDDDVVEIVYADKRGQLDSNWLWPSQGIWTPNYGQLLYFSKDSLIVFRQGQNLLRISKDWQEVLAVYNLKTDDDKNIYGFRVKSILNFTILEVDYRQQDQICSDWLWLKPDGKIFISRSLGLFRGRAICDTSLYIFFQWDKLILLSIDDWHISGYPFDFESQQPSPKLEDYKANIYRDEQGRLTAKIIYTKQSIGRWPYNYTFILSED